MVLIHVSLMTDEVECLLMCSLASYYIFFGEMSTQLFCPFLNYLSFYCWIEVVLLDLMISNYFLPSRGFSFIFLIVSFEAQSFEFQQPPLPHPVYSFIGSSSIVSSLLYSV